MYGLLCLNNLSNSTLPALCDCCRLPLCLLSGLLCLLLGQPLLLPCLNSCLLQCLCLLCQLSPSSLLQSTISLLSFHLLPLCCSVSLTVCNIVPFLLLLSFFSCLNSLCLPYL